MRCFAGRPTPGREGVVQLAAPNRNERWGAQGVRQPTTSPQTAPILSHVLAHEITHMLQGMSRHSKTGIMKAQFTPSDYSEMAMKSLSFADEDILLIQIGLKARATWDRLARLAVEAE
jgi:hypothetical protein